MKTAALQELEGWIEARLGQGDGPLVVAIDGRSGSGKTTLAAALARRFPASVTLHLDDFYLPLDRRAEGWAETPCANMDLERFRGEVLAPAREGREIPYRAWSCARGEYVPERLLPARPLVVVEGSYSHHPLLAPYYDRKVFVTCPPEEQARRLKEREGERYPNFARRWIPLEEGYFGAWKIPQGADQVVDTARESLI